MLEPNALKSSCERKRKKRQKNKRENVLPITNNMTVAVGKSDDLPPSCETELLGIHLAHVSQTNDANHGIFLGEDHTDSYLAAPR